MLTRLQAVAAKIETTAGTAIPLAAGDVFYAEDVSFTTDTPGLERNHHLPSMSKQASVAGRTFGTLAFNVLYYGGAAAGTAPFWGDLMLACGFSETVSAGVSVTYAPASAAIKTLTMKTFVDGISRQLIGARGTVSRSADAGGLPKLVFSFQGLWTPVTNTDAIKDETLLSGNAFPAFLPEKFQNARLTVGGTYLPVLHSWGWDIGNSLAMVPDANVTNYKRVDITDRDPSGSITVDAVIQATYDFVSKVADKTLVEVKGHLNANESGSGTGSLNTMTDATKNWITNQFSTGFKLVDSAGVVFTPTANNATTVTVAGTPAAGNYLIYKDGKLIQEIMPKVEFDTVSEGDNDGVFLYNLNFKMRQNLDAGNDEISIKLT